MVVTIATFMVVVIRSPVYLVPQELFLTAAQALSTHVQLQVLLLPALYRYGNNMCLTVWVLETRTSTAIYVTAKVQRLNPRNKTQLPLPVKLFVR